MTSPDSSSTSVLAQTVSDQVYDGRWFDPTTRASMLAIRELTKPATGTVTVGCYKGNIFFLKLSESIAGSLYNEARARRARRALPPPARVSAPPAVALLFARARARSLAPSSRASLA